MQPWQQDILHEVVPAAIAMVVAVLRSKVKAIYQDINAFFQKIRCLEARTQILEHERKISMQDIVIGIALKWLVAELATNATPASKEDMKAKVTTAIKAGIHSAWLSDELITVADQVVDAMYTVVHNEPGVLSVVRALAAKDMNAAEAAGKALIAPVVSGDLKKLLVA